MKTLLVAFDTETSGLSTAIEHVVQMSCVALSPGEPDSVVTFDALAKPPKAIEPGAAKTHGITDEHVAHCPSSAEVVASWWTALLEHAKDYDEVVMAGHNVTRYDIPLLQKYFDGPWPPFPVIDTLVLARRLYPTAPNHKLSYLVGEHHRLDAGLASRAHDGLADCYMVVKLLEFYSQSTALRNLNNNHKSDMVTVAAWTSTPSRLQVVPFGKNKGRPFNQLTRGELSWFVRQPNMDPDVVLSAREALGYT